MTIASDHTFPWKLVSFLICYFSFFTQVVHKATLDVDETGATAAAATGVEITLYSAFVNVPVLKFNRPFMIVITERSTHDILFLGKIINPNI